MGPLKVGTTLSNKYKIERLLAESGGVILYEATDTAHAKRVWVKILEREALANSAALARFQREAGGAKVLDVGKSEGGLPYMVASEFHPDEPAPAPAPARKVKTTLPGVAPPPAPLAANQDEEEEPPPPSSIPLLDDDLVVAEETPAPAPAKATPAKPKGSPPPVLVSPLLSPAEMPVLASPLITTPPPPLDDREPEVEVEVEDEAATVPLKPPKASQTPTIRIRDLPPSSPPVARWLVSLIVVASLTGILGFYLGQKDLRPTATPSESPTAPASLVPEEKTQTPTATSAAATTEPIPSSTNVATLATSAAPSATAESVTTSTVPPSTTTAAVTTVAEAKPPPVHTTPPAHTNTSPPPLVTTTRKPPTTHTTTTSDPLTL